jgi:hypothetical protein
VKIANAMEEFEASKSIPNLAPVLAKKAGISRC